MALFSACRIDHLEEVKRLLSQGADPNVRDEHQWTPLHHAINSTTIVQLLLQKGADPDARTEFGCTPLHFSAEKDLSDVAQLLLEHGANPNIHDDQGTTPLDTAAARGHASFTKLLLEHGAAPYSSLDTAIGSGHLPVLKVFLERGIYPQDTSWYWVPVHSGRRDIVELLLYWSPVRIDYLPTFDLEMLTAHKRYHQTKRYDHYYSTIRKYEPQRANEIYLLHLLYQRQHSTLSILLLFPVQWK